MSSANTQRITLRCARCGAKLRVPSRATGRRIECPRCHTRLVVPGQAGGGRSDSSDRIQATCGACGARMRVPAAAAGRRVKCPRCGAGVPVPATAPAGDPLEPPDPLSSADDALLEQLAHGSEPAGPEPPAAPAAQVRPCPHCGAPVAAGVNLCAHCGRDVSKAARAQRASTALATLGWVGKQAGTVLLGVLLSVLGATLGAIIWAVVAYKTNYELGWIAWGLGLLAGLGMYVGHRDYSPLAGMVAAGIALVGIVVAKVVVFSLLLYVVVTANTNNPKLRRQVLIVRIAAESLDERGVEPGDENYEILRKSAVSEAEAQVKRMSDEQVSQRLEAYLAEEAELAEANEPAAPTRPNEAAASVEAAPTADSGEETDFGPVLLVFFRTMFSFIDIAFVALAMLTAYRLGAYGWGEKRT